MRQLLAVAVAVAGLYLAGTVSAAFIEAEPAPPKMIGTAEQPDPGFARHCLQVAGTRPSCVPAFIHASPDD